MLIVVVTVTPPGELRLVGTLVATHYCVREALELTINKSWLQFIVSLCLLEGPLGVSCKWFWSLIDRSRFLIRFRF